MRWLLVPVGLLYAGLAVGQSAPAGTPVVGGVSIPVELRTSLRADKVHRGDGVELRSVEPVLLGNGVVMPANAKLSGRIVGAAPLQDGKPSWLVLLVEKAEWKQQSVALHAFIARQLKVESKHSVSGPQTESASQSVSPRRRGRMSARVMLEGSADMPGTPLPEDSGAVAPTSSVARPLLPDDTRIVTDSDGIVYLFSAGSNVSLPSGVLLVLQNQSKQKQSNQIGPGPAQQLVAAER